MRWAVAFTLLCAFAFYYLVSDEPLGSPQRSYVEAELIEEGSSDPPPPQELQARNSGSIEVPNDPAYGPARAVVVRKKGDRFVAGPGSSGGLEEGMALRVFRGRNPKSQDQWVGQVRVVECLTDVAEVQLVEGEVEVDDFLISDGRDLPRDVYLPRATLTQRPVPPRPSAGPIVVRLQALAPSPGRELVSFGVPFPPGALVSDRNVSVFAGNVEIPAFTRILAPWRIDAQAGTARSVLVQFELDFASGREQTVSIRWDRPRTQSRTQEIPASSLLTKQQHLTKVRGQHAVLEYEEPRVLAVLPPQWLCDSWAAGPQTPAADKSLLPQFDKVLKEAYRKQTADLRLDANLSGEYAEQQLDRTITLYRMYFRSGDSQLALDSFRHATFYRRQIVTRDASRRGRGAFALKHSPADLESEWIDVKYAYSEGPMLHYLLTGDERFLRTLDDMTAFWSSPFADFLHNDYTLKRAPWTERYCAFAWLHWLHTYQITGDTDCLSRAREQCEHVFHMQFQPGDGLTPDGSWRHSYADHGEDGPTLGSSVWMSALLVDAIFQHWLLTGDERCPHMLVAYCEFAERYGMTWFSWADQTQDNSDVPRWAQPWYYASAVHAGISESGGESDHNIETGYVFLMGYYFRRDPRYLYWGRELLGYAPVRTHPRMFTWCYRASPQGLWFLKAAGAAP